MNQSSSPKNVSDDVTDSKLGVTSRSSVDDDVISVEEVLEEGGEEQSGSSSSEAVLDLSEAGVEGDSPGKERVNRMSEGTSSSEESLEQVESLKPALATSNEKCANEFAESQKEQEEEEATKSSSNQQEQDLDNAKHCDEDNRDYTREDCTMPSVEVVNCPKATMRDLAEPVFDVWRLDRDSMVDHIEYMYHDLGVVKAWRIPRATLRMFLLGVRERYQDNPYHNFKHCFCVTQMAYSMMCKLRLRGLVSVDYLGALLTAAVCHDVDHPGLNNAYHSHARTPLAILYNYKSILEQHHFAVTCRLLSNRERNIFRNVNNRDEVLTNVGELILATDLARHKEVMETYAANVEHGFDFQNGKHVLSILKIIIKCADVSNEVRPETVASPWVERLFAEYSEQSAREKRERLPVTSYMDPELVNVAESQENFIRGIMLPMYDELCKLVVDARLYYVAPLYEALMRYEVQTIREREA